MWLKASSIFQVSPARFGPTSSKSFAGITISPSHQRPPKGAVPAAVSRTAVLKWGRQLRKIWPTDTRPRSPSEPKQVMKNL